jgi:hypothetical protein
MRLFLTCLIITSSFGDVILTRIGLRRAHKELNPIARFISMRLAYALRIFFGIFMGITGYFIADMKGLFFAALAFGGVCCWNTFAIYHRLSKAQRHIYFRNGINT